MSTEGYQASVPDDPIWAPYRYVPSRVAAIVFVILFALSSGLHVFQLIKKRTWYFIAMALGGILETIGYVGRILSSRDPNALGPFIVQNSLLLVAPALFAAAIYIILGKIIYTTGKQYSAIKHTWLANLFVAGDVFSFCTQAAGGGIQTMGTLDFLYLGEKIIIAGLVIQLAIFAAFVYVAGSFHYRIIHDRPCRHQFPRTSKSADDIATQRGTALSPLEGSKILPWRKQIFLLYAGSALIMIRNVFRVIEYAEGNNGYLLRHEIFLYVFDAALMFALMVLFNWGHPSELTDLYTRMKAGDGVENVALVPRLS